MKELMVTKESEDFYTNKFSNFSSSGDTKNKLTNYRHNIASDYIIPEEIDNGATLLTATDKFNNVNNPNFTITNETFLNKDGSK